MVNNVHALEDNFYKLLFKFKDKQIKDWMRIKKGCRKFKISFIDHKIKRFKLFRSQMCKIKKNKIILPENTKQLDLATFI